MDDWLRNMGDWNISRKRYFGLPLPFYPCECGHLNVIGSRAELEARAVGGLEQLEELHRPWIDAVPIRCEQCDQQVERIKEVGDVWLDAGIVHFSTLGWHNPTWREHGYATGASAGLTGADLPDHAYWEKWYPADWVSEMREQIRLWFYSQLFMAVTLTGRSPYRQVLGVREDASTSAASEMHKSTGQHDRANEAFERMGADVMRWQYCAQPPSRSLLRFGFGAGGGDQAQAADALELGLVLRHVREHRRVPAGLVVARAVGRAEAARPVARRADARVRRRRDRRLRVVADRRRDPRLRGVPRRSLQLVHPALALAVLGGRPGGAADALVRARPDAARARADHAVPDGAPLAKSRRGRVHGRAGVGAPRAVAGDGAARPGVAGRGRRTSGASSRSRIRRAQRRR